MTRIAWMVLLLSAPAGLAFQAGPPQDGIVNPQVIPRGEPKYTEEARSAGVQGTVVLSVVIDQQGVPKDIRVVSPLGFGLDEAAMAAVALWRFRPGTKDGKPVAIVGQIEVSFRLRNTGFDEKKEKQRTLYNAAVNSLKQGKRDKAVIDSLRNLVSQKYPPGMFLYGKALVEGWGIAADPATGYRLLEDSAAKHYGPALYEVAIARIQGGQLEQDPQKGFEQMRSAARLGSEQAQAFLGQAYEQGEGVPVDLNKSRENYRLCAATGDAACQYHLGKSLLEANGHISLDYVQAIAWLELASSGGIEDAEKILQQEDAQLTPDQISRADKLKAQLVHKP